MSGKSRATVDKSRYINSILKPERDEKEILELVKQVKAVVHSDDNDIISALHECNYDVAETVNKLLEAAPSNSWTTVGKKKVGTHFYFHPPKQ